jgi:site-specific DNA-methyltransferase (adenine-specific)
MTIYNADCMEIMKQYSDNYFDLAVVDPPYNLARFKKGIGENDRHTIKTKSTLWNNNAPSPEYFKELFRVSKNQIIWGANNFTLPETEYFLIWDKQQTVDNFASAEYAWVSMGLKVPAKIFHYGIHKHNADKDKKIHPTQKPIKLYSYIYNMYAKEGQKILDTHLGSGSNAISAHYKKMGEFVGCELDEDYFKAACERIRKETRQLELF